MVPTTRASDPAHRWWTLVQPDFTDEIHPDGSTSAADVPRRFGARTAGESTGQGGWNKNPWPVVLNLDGCSKARHTGVQGGHST